MWRPVLRATKTHFGCATEVLGTKIGHRHHGSISFAIFNRAATHASILGKFYFYCSILFYSRQLGKSWYWVLWPAFEYLRRHT